MKSISRLPIEIEELFKTQFSFPNKLLFGSVATIKNTHPNIRTMRIYEFNSDGCPILLTHTGSNKWKEFINTPQVSINIVSESKLIQVVISGHLILNTSSSSEEIAKQYWNMVRSDVKKIYDPTYRIEEVYNEDEFKELIAPEEAPDTFGIAYVIPNFWEVLYLESEYTKSQRYQFYWNEGTWLKQRVYVG